jgi:hypothetical protein
VKLSLLIRLNDSAEHLGQLRGQKLASSGHIMAGDADVVCQDLERRDVTRSCHRMLVQARKAVGEHVYGMISQGETGGQAASPLTACRQACSDCPSTMPRQISVSS